MTVIADQQVAPRAAEALWLRLMPGLFVVLWSTGFIGAKYGLPYADPLTFLAIRFGGVGAAMSVVALLSGAPWPGSWRQVGHHALVGVLIQGVYLGGVYFAIAHGISAGISALIVGLQPVLTAAVVGWLLGEAVRPRQWAGVVLGFAGVVLVVWSKIAIDVGELAGLAACVIGLLGITGGTLYQKRFGAGDLRMATAIQNLAAFLAVLLGASIFEDMRVSWRPELIFSLAWLSLVLSIGAYSLFLFLLRRGAAARVTSLFYLVPPVTAFMAFLLFGETLGVTALGGMALTALGVALVNR